MDTFLRPSTNDDEIGRLNQRLLGVLRGDTDNEELLSFRQSVLDRTSSIPDPQERQRALGNLALINEDAVEQLGKVYDLPSEKNRQGVTKWYNHFKDEWVQGKSKVHPVERINKWIDAKLSSAASQAEADSIKTGGMADVGRFVGEVVKAPVEGPFRLGVDAGNVIDTVIGTDSISEQGYSTFNFGQAKDPVANMQTSSQVLAGLTGVEPTERAYFSGNFDPATEEYSEPNKIGAVAYAAGAGAREVVKALSFGALLSRAGATEAIASATGSAVGKIAPSAARYAVPAAQEITSSIPVFMLLGAGGRGEAGEGVGSVTDLAKDAATGALFGGITAAFQQGGRAFFASKNPAVNQLGAALERSGGELTDDVIGAFKKIGDPAKVQDGINTAVAAARAFDTKIAVGEVATQFVAGYTLDIAQGAPVEDALVNGIMFGVLDVARAKGIRINENEAVQLRSVTKQIMERGVGEAKITNPAKQPVDLPPDTDAVALSRIAENPPPEADRYGAEIQVPVEAVSYNYRGAHKYPFQLERIENPETPLKPEEFWARDFTKRLGSMSRRNRNLPDSTLGAFWAYNGQTETRHRNDTSTKLHETVGHFLDSHHLIVTESWLSETPQASKELLQFFQPGDNDLDTVVRKESFAAWAQSFMQAPQATMAATPVVTARVRERLGEKRFNYLLQNSEVYRTYRSLDDNQKWAAGIVARPDKYPTIPQKMMGDVMNNLGYSEVGVFTTNWADQAKQAMFNKMSSAWKALGWARGVKGELKDGKFTTEMLEQSEAFQTTTLLGGVGDQLNMIEKVGVPRLAEDPHQFYEGTEGGWEYNAYEKHGLNTPEQRLDADLYRMAERVTELAERTAADIFDARWPEIAQMLDKPTKALADATARRDAAIEKRNAGKGSAESAKEWRVRRNKINRQIRDAEAAMAKAQAELDRAMIDRDIAEKELKLEMGLALEDDYVQGADAWGTSLAIGAKPRGGHLATERSISKVAGQALERRISGIEERIDDPATDKKQRARLKRELKKLKDSAGSIAEGDDTRVTQSLRTETNYGQAKQIMDNLRAKYGDDFARLEAASEDGRAYMDAGMQLVHDLGYISTADLENMRLRNQHYATLERVDDEITQGTSGLEQAKGSTRATAAIGDSMIAKLQRVVKTALENNARRAIADEFTGEGKYHGGTNEQLLNSLMRYIGRTEIGMAGKTASSNQGAAQRKAIERMQKEARRANAELDDLRRISGETEDQFVARRKKLRKKVDTLRKKIAATEEKLMGLPALDSAEAGQVWKVRRIVDGKSMMYHYVIPDKLVYDALSSIGKTESLHTAVRIAGYLPRVMRQFITHSPYFIPRNLWRGTMARFVYGAKGSTPLDVFMSKYVSEEQMNKIRAAGGSGAGVISELKSTYDINLAKAKKKTAGNGPLSLFAPLAEPFKWWMNLAETMELRERAPEYWRVYEDQIAKGADPLSASRLAAIRTRGLADYAVIGSHMRAINYMFPFTNAAIQSMAAAIRNVKRDPTKAAINWGLGVALPTIIVYEMSRALDYEEEYLDLPAYQRDFFWNLKVGPDFWIRIPKPFEIGVLASGVERLYAALVYGHENQAEGYLDSAWKAGMPIDTGNAIYGPFKTFVEMKTNYDDFRDRPIIPAWEAKLDVELREGKENASRLGKLLYSMSGVDPRHWDFFTRSQFGDYAWLAQQASNIGRDDRPVDPKRFVGVGSPVTGARSVNRVLKEAERLGIDDNSIRQLKAMRSAFYAMPDAEHRDALGKQMREYARGIEKYFLPSWRLKVGQ